MMCVDCGAWLEPDEQGMICPVCPKCLVNYEEE